MNGVRCDVTGDKAEKKQEGVTDRPVEHRCSAVVLIFLRFSRNKVEPLSPIGAKLAAPGGYSVVCSRVSLVFGPKYLCSRRIPQS